MARIEPFPPSDETAERACLGSILIDGPAFDLVSGIVRPSDFALEHHAAIFRAMSNLAASATPVDYVTLIAELDRLGQLGAVGGPAYITELIGAVPTSVHAEHYSKIVQRLARQRRWIAGAGKLAEAAYSGNGDLDPAAIARRLLAEDDQRLPAEVRFSTWADLDGILDAVTWSWPGWLPCGFLTIIAGEQESGKSQVCLRIAATCLTGDPWPDGQPDEAQPGAVCWAEAESGQALNRDRARAWGLPVDRILSPLGDPIGDFRLDNPSHIQSLQVAASDPGVRLVVLDSLSGAHSRRENDAEMVGVIKTLAEIARNTQKPILLSHHLRKRSLLDVGDDGPTLERIRGSGAITQTARAVWILDRPDPNLPERRRLSLAKCNLSGQRPKPLGFTIDDAGLTFGQAPEPPKEETQLDRAIELLQTLLDGGPMAATAIEEEAQGAAISWRTVTRAKEVLHVVARRLNNRWVWCLPAGASDV